MPCCNIWFPCEETGLTANGYMTDIAGGVTYQPSLDADGGTIDNGVTAVNSVLPTNGPDFFETPLRSGTWPNFGTKSVMNFAVGNISDAPRVKIPFGSADGVHPLITCSFSSGMHTVISDGVTTSRVDFDTTKTLTNGQDVLIIVRYAPATLLQADVYNLSGVLVASGTTPFPNLTQTMTPSGAIGSFQPVPFSRITGISLYGWAGFSFTAGIPSDWLTGCLWMAKDWTSKNTNRYLYPRWASLT